jgi:ABC-type sulfate/molybdate transport systems ATPase subunit
VHARHEVRSVLAHTLRRLSLPTVVVTHDPSDARELGEHIAVIESGRITQQGRWSDLITSPASLFVEEFVAGSARYAVTASRL